MKLTPDSNATGWVNALNGGGVYYFGSGVVRITVTAKNVDGVKILDWDKDQYRSPEVAANDNKHATITAVFDLGASGRLVTRFLNPQANAEGIMTVETAPPPRVLAGFTAFLRRWRHGAKETSPGAGQCAYELHRKNTVLPELVYVGASTTTPWTYSRRYQRKIGNRIRTLAFRGSRRASVDLPGRRKHGRTHQGHLRLRGPARTVQPASHGTAYLDTHTPALTIAGGEACGA